MTTGNRISDLTTSVSTNAGPGKIGTYWEKTWSGTDQPSSVPVKNDFTSVQTYIREPRTDVSRKGKRRTYYVRVLGPVKLIRVWRKLPKRAKRGEHAYNMTLNTWYDSIGQKQNVPYQNYWSTATFRNSFGGGSFTTAWTANDDIALLGKLRESVAGSSFNAAVSMAEGMQSVQLIAQIAKQVSNAMHSFSKKRGSVSRSTHLLTGNHVNLNQTVSANHLMVQYGVLPLLSDVFEAAKFLAHLSSTPLQQVITVSRRREGVISSGTPSFIGLKGYGYETVKIKAILKEVDVISLLGLTDPASVAWEKLPYSFVADWFIPVGAYLSARGLAQSLTGTFVTSRTRKWHAHSPFVSNPGINPGGVYEIKDFGYHQEFTSLTRTVSSALSVPKPEFKPLNKVLSWQHATNAVALLIGRFGSKG